MIITIGAETRHNTWEGGEVIYKELCKKFKFDDTNKWYMHNPESVLENEMRKVLWDFEIETDHLILARRPDLVIINTKREPVELWTDHKVKFKER